jgi:3-oxoacyl-[acyl-carrier-protein] synthase III
LVPNQRHRAIGILGTGSHLPPRVLTNHDLEKIVDTSDEWIRSRTGIVERHIVDDGVACSDLAAEAGRRACEAAGVDPSEIDLIICATFTPDTICPSTACHVQGKLGNTRAFAFDLEAACSGFVYSLSVAWHFLETGRYRHALVMGSEAMSRFIDWEDRNTCVLFADGAGAVVLGEVEEGKGILSEHMGADGSQTDLIIIPGCGSMNPASPSVLEGREQFLKMRGNDVFKFAVRIVGEAVEKALEPTGLTQDDIDWLIPHQANIRIIEAAGKRLNLPRERVVVNLDRCGNTSAATIPIALDEIVREGKVKDGDILALVAFGGGLTWGANIIRW